MDIDKILIEADDETGIEAPADGMRPWDEMHGSVTRIRDKIRDRLGLELEVDGNVQDASYHEELRVLAPESYVSEQVTAFVYDLGIRFSNFGRLYTIFGATGALKKYPVEEIKGIVYEEGWFFVDPADLQATYYGKNKRLHGISWWDRFFDYV